MFLVYKSWFLRSSKTRQQNQDRGNRMDLFANGPSRVDSFSTSSFSSPKSHRRSNLHQHFMDFRQRFIRVEVGVRRGCVVVFWLVKVDYSKFHTEKHACVQMLTTMVHLWTDFLSIPVQYPKHAVLSRNFS